MQRGRALHAVQRALERRQRVAARLLGARLHPRLVELHDVGAGGEEVEHLLAHDVGVGEGQLLLALVEVVLGLLGHGERAGQRDLHEAVRVGAQEAQVVDGQRLVAAQRAGDARDGDRVAAAVQRRPGALEIDPVQRGGEAVGVALAADLAVGDDVQPGALLVADGEQRRVVLGLARASAGRRATARARARARERAACSASRSMSQSGCG